MSVSTMARFIARAPDIRHAKLLQRGLECVEVVIAFVAPGGHRRGFCIRGGLVSGLADDLLGDSEPLGGAQRTQLREDLFAQTRYSSMNAAAGRSPRPAGLP